MDPFYALPDKAKGADNTHDALLIGEGKAPIRWEYYPLWGSQAGKAVVLMDGRKRYGIPATDEQVSSYHTSFEETVYQNACNNCRYCFKECGDTRALDAKLHTARPNAD
jgi:hypothetical protein